MQSCSWEFLEYSGCLQSCLWGWRELRQRLDAIQPQVSGRVLLIPANGSSGLPEAYDPVLLRKIRQEHENGSIIASVCAGAAWIAKAGIDRGRPLTTHWSLASGLAAMREDLQVSISSLVIDHGDIVTAGGLLAWVDLGLHLTERFWGGETADQIARILVWDRSRSSQLPYTALGQSWQPLRPDPFLDAAIAWIRNHYFTRVSVAEWAEASGIGLRSLQRRWVSVFGEAPLRWLQSIRIEEARRLLETSTETWDTITQRCGYTDAASFRELFEDRMGCSPGGYRRSFSGTRILEAGARNEDR